MIGFDMQFAGSKNGQAHGKGTYFALSDHVATIYNRKSSHKAGTCIVALLLTKDEIGWQHGRNPGTFTVEMNDEYAKLYHTFRLNSQISEVDNCVLVHDLHVVMPLGLVVPV